MAVECETCHQFHDHNIMEHIYLLEWKVRKLLERVEVLEKKKEKSITKLRRSNK